MRVILLLAFVLIQGCAFTTARLNVALPPGATIKGPLSEVAPKKFDLQALTDQRSDKARIGWKKNGFGSHTADVLSTRPVTDVVADAIRTGLQQNGHAISMPSNVVISGSVTRFWFEMKTNVLTIEFTGNVECELRFINAATNQEIYKSRYNGTYSRDVALGTEATWTEIMDTSLQKLVEDIVFDANLAESLNKPL